MMSVDLVVTVYRTDWHGAVAQLSYIGTIWQLSADVGRTSKKIVKNMAEQISLVSEDNMQIFPGNVHPSSLVRLMLLPLQWICEPRKE